jgi:hypothetical protein
MLSQWTPRAAASSKDPSSVYIFAVLMLNEDCPEPSAIWNDSTCREWLTDGCMLRIRASHHLFRTDPTEANMRLQADDEALRHLDDLLSARNKHLADFGMPEPSGQLPASSIDDERTEVV